MWRLEVLEYQFEVYVMETVKKYMTRETAVLAVGAIALIVGLSADAQADLLDAVIVIGGLLLGYGRVQAQE